jgi:hypothetical protein
MTGPENLAYTASSHMIKRVSVNINPRLALFIPPNTPPAAPDGTVFRELDDLDTIFTTALVVNFWPNRIRGGPRVRGRSDR